MNTNTISPADKVEKILLDMGMEKTMLEPNASLSHDLGFDSLDFADFIMQIELAFDITIPIDEVENQCKTIGDSVRIVENVLQKVSS